MKKNKTVSKTVNLSYFSQQNFCVLQRFYLEKIHIFVKKQKKSFWPLFALFEIFLFKRFEKNIFLKR